MFSNQALQTNEHDSHGMGSTRTTEPAIYISKEFSSDWDLEGKGSWKWVAKRSTTHGGATRIEICEVPEDAEGAERETVESMISFLTGHPSDGSVRYAISQADEEPRFVAVRIG